MLSFKFVVTALCIGSVVSSGVIISPPHRGPAGPIMITECGQSVFDLLSADPGASVPEIRAVMDSRFTATCNLGFCSAYQLGDNSESINVLKLNHPIDITVNVTTPPMPNPGNALDEYTFGIHMVDLDHNFGYNALELAFTPGVQKLAVQTVSWWNEHVTHWQPPKCASAGECAMMWRVEDYFTTINGTSGRTFADVQCFDFVIDWSS